MTMENKRTLGTNAFASKFCASLQAVADYTRTKVVSRAKVILPYLLMYYVLPTVLSLAYTFLSRSCKINHIYIDIKNPSNIQVCVEVPALMIPGGTKIRNMKVKVGFGDSDVHAFTLVSRSAYEWRHHQKLYFCECIDIVHNKFDFKGIRAFIKEKSSAWVAAGCDLGIDILVGTIYFRVPAIKIGIGYPGGPNCKMFSIISGTAHENNDCISVSMQVQPELPSFLSLSVPKFSLEVCRGSDCESEKPSRLCKVSLEPSEWTGCDTKTITCAASSQKTDLENIKNIIRNMESMKGGAGDKKITIVFRLQDTDSFPKVSKNYVDAIIAGAEVVLSVENIQDKRCGVDDPLIRAKISQVGPKEVRGAIAFHRAFFPNEYIYELARNVKYDDISMQADLNDKKVASGYVRNKVEHAEDYVCCEFRGEIHDWRPLIRSVLFPKEKVLSVGAVCTHSMLSYFLSVWVLFVQFEGGTKVTSLGLANLKHSKKVDYLKNNPINISTKVVADSKDSLHLQARMYTEKYRSKRFFLLEIPEYLYFIVDRPWLRTIVIISSGCVVFNENVPIGRLVSIENSIVFNVFFSRKEFFDRKDRSCDTAENSVHQLLSFLLGEEMTQGRTQKSVPDKQEEDNSEKKFLGIEKTSVMLEEILSYNACKVNLTFQGGDKEDAFVKMKLRIPRMKATMFPIKNDRIDDQAFVSTEVDPFKLWIKVGRNGVVLRKAVNTTVPVSISIKFSEDMMAGRFTFMYNVEDTLFSYMLGFCLNFFRVSLDMLNDLEHKKRDLENNISCSPFVPVVACNFGLHMGTSPSVDASLHIDGGDCLEKKFSIDTRRIGISVFGCTKNTPNPQDNDRVEEVFFMDVSPLGINLKQKNINSFYQKDIDIALRSKVCILCYDQYEFRIEYGERNSATVASKINKFTLSKHDILAAVQFLRNFYGGGACKVQEQHDKKSWIRESLESALSFLPSAWRKVKRSASSSSEETASKILIRKSPDADAESGDGRIQHIICVQNSRSLLKASSLVGSVLKRINIEKYPEVLSIQTKLQITGTGGEACSPCYEVIVDEFPVVYKEAGQTDKNVFKFKFLCPAKNELVFKVPSSGSGGGSFVDFLRSIGVTDNIFSLDGKKNMYYKTIHTNFISNTGLCIEIFSGESMSLKFNTALCIYRENTTILPLFFKPRDFIREEFDLSVRIYLDGKLIHTMKIKIKIGVVSLVFAFILRCLPTSLFDWLVFSKNDSVVIDKEEFIEKFNAMCGPTPQKATRSERVHRLSAARLCVV